MGKLGDEDIHTTTHSTNGEFRHRTSAAGVLIAKISSMATSGMQFDGRSATHRHVPECVGCCCWYTLHMVYYNSSDILQVAVYSTVPLILREDEDKVYI